MAKEKYAGPAAKLQQYLELLAAHPEAERKGAANPYTSLNGWMTSFLDKTGEVSLRMDTPAIDQLIESHGTQRPVQYGKTMADFVVVPDDVFDDLDIAGEWFARSWDHVATLAPKPTTRTKKKA